MSIQYANIHFNENGTPVADDFDDVYFSNASGLQESEYVFFNNNHLAEKWANWSRPDFVIAETGFGTGLNFLLTWQKFAQFKQSAPTTPLKRLYFISTEKFPLSRDALQQALAHWPELNELTAALLVQYPMALTGCHRLVLPLTEGSEIILDLYLGDIQTTLPCVQSPEGGLVDAWYLDGFAPSKNPQMWSPTLFKQMARLSRPDASFATFTAAGVVKRGLKEVGFEIEKRQGFGHKRDMLAGRFTAEKPRLNSYYQRQPAEVLACPTQNKRKVAIIGAGLAGACLSHTLLQKGYAVDVYCKDAQVAEGASGNIQGGFYPHLNATASLASQFHASAFLYARRFYQALSQNPQAQKYQNEFAHDWCGVLLPGFSDTVAERQQKLISNQAWPPELVHALNAQQASDAAGIDVPYPSLFIPLGGWISPKEVVQTLLKQCAHSPDFKLHLDHRLLNCDHALNLTWQNQPETSADIVIYAGGSDSLDIESLQGLPLRVIRGQVEHVPSSAETNQLQTVLCHKGYFTPAYQGCHALGSTYVKNDIETEYRADEGEQNLATHLKAMHKCEWVHTLKLDGQGRAGIRCSTPDHVPMMGAVPDLSAQAQQFADLYKALPKTHYPLAENKPNQFVLTGLGSRGLTTAPLLAEALACQISGEPMPLNAKLLASLNPNRFLVRDLIRRQS